VKNSSYFAGESIPVEEGTKQDFEEIFKNEEYMDINNEGKQGETKGERKKPNYFDQLIDETKQNDFLYCPYLDQFDKIWVQNNCKKAKDNTILSCCGCFTNVCFAHEKLRFFTNMYISKEMKNIFLDYFEVYDYDKLIDVFKQNINSFKYNKGEIEAIGICAEIKSHFVGVKCSSCYNLLAAFDADKKSYYIFNSI
jgi:hypothetical protein